LDEFLSEKEQLERIRAWWRENGWYLIGGLVLGALLLFGWNRYQAHQMREAEMAGELYAALREAVESNTPNRARELLTQINAEFPSSPYADQAALLMARMDVIGAPGEAEAQLRHVMEQSHDPNLALIARLRLGRLLAYQESYAEALAVLGGAQAPGPYAARFDEVTGDIHTALGDYEAARAAYQRALSSPSGEILLDRNFVQMKIDDLPRAEVVGADSGAGEIRE
jgi:predicted negative regulator of RcsB-dependent stress response